MKGICPSCEKETDIQLIENQPTISVRGEDIEVVEQYFKCSACGEAFENTRTPDALDMAYRKYRHRHGMVQPEEIRDWRKTYGLTQSELGSLLGWGETTLSRYENGALQEEGNDVLLKFAMNPLNLLLLIEEKPSTLSTDKRAQLVHKLSSHDTVATCLKHIYEECFGNYMPDEFSGYKKLDTQKFFNAVLFFCKEGGQIKTKLNKLLFYADFKHFKKHQVSITGTRYARDTYGPVPENYEHFFGLLTLNHEVRTEETDFGGYFGDKYVSEKLPNLSAVFSQSEIKVLLAVQEYFKHFNAKEIREYLHQEKGFLETPERQFISYNYADFLKTES